MQSKGVNSLPRLIIQEEPQDETEESAMFNGVLSNWIVGATFSVFILTVTYFSLLVFLRRPHPNDSQNDFSSNRNLSKISSFDGKFSSPNSSPSKNSSVHRRRTDYKPSESILVENEEIDDELDDESNEEILPFSLCMIGASVFAAALLLVPLTIISHQVLIAYPKNWYVQWLRKDLITSFWDAIFFLNIISLLVLLPFAHLYEEAVGFGQTNLQHSGYRRRSFMARLYETAFELLIFITLLSGIVYLLYCIVGEDDTNYLLFAYSLVSSIGSILFLLSTPLGFTSLTKWSFALKTPFISSESISIRKEVIALQSEVLHRRLNDKHLKDEERDKILREMKANQKEKKEAEAATVKGPIFWNTLSIICTTVNVFFPIVIVLEVFLFMAKGFVWEQQVYDFSTFGSINQSTLDSLKFGLETMVVSYAMVAALFGFYQLSVMNRIRPRIRKTTVRRLTLNVGCVLILSSSFPIVFRILGLTSFDLIGFYSYANYIRNDELRLLFRGGFMFSMTQRYFELFPPTRYAYQYLVNITKRGFLFIVRMIQTGIERVWERRAGRKETIRR